MSFAALAGPVARAIGLKLADFALDEAAKEVRRRAKGSRGKAPTKKRAKARRKKKKPGGW